MKTTNMLKEKVKDQLREDFNEWAREIWRLMLKEQPIELSESEVTICDG